MAVRALQFAWFRKFGDLRAFEDAELFFFPVFHGGRQRHARLLSQVDVMQKKAVHLREFSDIEIDQRTGKSRAIGLRYVAGFAKILWNVRSVVQVLREFGLLGDQHDRLARIIDQRLVMAVMAGGQLTVDAVLPSDRGIVVDVAGRAETIVFPDVLIKFITGNTADQSAHEQPGRDEDQKGPDSLPDILHHTPP